MSHELVKTKVAVSRHWHNPAITVSLHRERPGVIGGLVSLDVTAEDFLKAVAAEIGKSRFALTDRAFLDAVLTAGAVMVEKIKDSSSHVLTPGAGDRQVF